MKSGRQKVPISVSRKPKLVDADMDWAGFRLQALPGYGKSLVFGGAALLALRQIAYSQCGLQPLRSLERLFPQPPSLGFESAIILARRRPALSISEPCQYVARRLNPETQSLKPRAWALKP